MSVLSRIESMKNELSLSEKKLFAFMEANPEKVPSMTASQGENRSGFYLARQSQNEGNVQFILHRGSVHQPLYVLRKKPALLV